MFAGDDKPDTRPPCSFVHLLQKDSKNIYRINFASKTSKIEKGRL